jgi:subtilisin family serine protease
MDNSIVPQLDRETLTVAFSRSVTHRLLISALISAFVLVWVTGTAAPVSASGLGQTTRFSELYQKSQQNGKLRLIVTLNTGFQPEGNLSASARASQRATIKQAQTRFLNTLTTVSYDLIASYDLMPIVALMGDSSVIALLAANPDVQYLQEDIPEPPSDTSTATVIGLTAAHSSGYDGTGWTVVILDTGVQSDHPYFTGRIVDGACFSTTSGTTSTTVCPNGQSTSSGVPGMTGVSAGTNCPTTTYGCDHGTHVAGIAAGKNYTGGPGYEGVAKGANIIAVQVFSQFTGTTCTNAGVTSPCAFTYTTDQLAALQYVYSTWSVSYSIASINMSLGGGQNTVACDSDSRKTTIDNLRSINIATVIASGNSGYTAAIAAPACISTAVSVGSTTDADAVASYSNRASFMSLYAPGSSVDSAVPSSTYASKNGTSMAAPHVAGAWAVLKQKKPTGTVAEILTLIQNNGVSITDSGFTIKRLKLDTALNAIPTSTPTASRTNTLTPTRTNTNTPTRTNTSTPSQTYTPSRTNTLTPSRTHTATVTQTHTPSRTFITPSTNTVTPSSTHTPSQTFTPSSTHTATVTQTYTATNTFTPTLTFTPSRTNTATATNTVTPSRTNTATPTASPTLTPVPPRPDTIGVFKDGQWSLRNTNNAGSPDITALFGIAGDLPVVGDWNNDGVDTIGLYRNGLFFLSDSNTSPNVDYNPAFGMVGDLPLAGKWDNLTAGSGIGVYRPSNGVAYLRRSPTAGFEHYYMFAGDPGDQVIVGDWDGNGYDGIGVYRINNQKWYLTNTIATGLAYSDIDFVYGIDTHRPIIGDWDGDLVTTVGYFTASGVFALHSTNATVGSDNVFAFGPTDAYPVSGKWVAAAQPAAFTVIGGANGSRPPVTNGSDDGRTD